MRKTPVIEAFEAPCLGCATPLAYVVDHSGTVPEILPPMFGEAYRDGHLCGDCAGAVADLLRTRRAPFVALPTSTDGLSGDTVRYDDASEVA